MDSRRVFALRREARNLEGELKLGKLIEAIAIARILYGNDLNDEWVQKAYGWVLIDLCKYYIALSDTGTAKKFYDELLQIDFLDFDDILESQIEYVWSRLDPNYEGIAQAKALSNDGKHCEALAIYKELIAGGKLENLHHDSYGWTIYRYLRDSSDSLSSLEVRSLLRDYMELENERPSMLHSMILNFSLNYSKKNNDFRFFDFLKLWNPHNFRDQDLRDSKNETGDVITSLISRVCREFVNRNIIFNISDVFQGIKMDKSKILDFFREPFFWKLFQAHKENQFNELWKLFDEYNTHYGHYGPSKWHSEVLSLANRFMKETEELRFLSFFKNWNPDFLREQDWKETVVDEAVYKPLGPQVLKKAFGIIKKQKENHDVSWLISVYNTAIIKFPEDEWLLREKALLHTRNNEFNKAIEIFKQLVLELSDKYYIWQEFSECIKSDNKIKIGMLAKALRLEKNEDFLGDIHLALAETLLEENLKEHAFIELELYRKHRELKNWRLDPYYEDLAKKAEAGNLKNNNELYESYILLAENYAYGNIPWTEVVFIDKWKNKKDKERLTFGNGKDLEFIVRRKQFKVLKNAQVGEIFNVRLFKKEVEKKVDDFFYFISEKIVKEYKYVPLVVQKSEKANWEILEDCYAVVDYINVEKQIIHAITTDNKEVFFPQLEKKLKTGDFLAAKILQKKRNDEIRTELRNIKPVDSEEALQKFSQDIAVVDGINDSKSLFHFVISKDLQGIIRYDETEIRPKEGDFLKITYALKKDKKKKQRVNVLQAKTTDEINLNLRKEIDGTLVVKYKSENRPDNDEVLYGGKGFTNDSQWKDEIEKRYIYEFDDIPSEKEISEILEITKELLNGNREDSEIKKEEVNTHLNEVEDCFEGEITEDMFDERGKLLLDKILPKKQEEVQDENFLDLIFHAIAYDVYQKHLRFKTMPLTKGPDFAFIGNYYVSKEVLRKHSITQNCMVRGIAISTGDKWKVIDLKITDNVVEDDYDSLIDFQDDFDEDETYF